MNLHAIAAGPISAVNPFILGTVSFSTGSTENPDGTRTPTYTVIPNMRLQVQPVTWRDLQQLEGLNLQGTRVKIYVFGRIDGLVRNTMQGGDLITIPSGVNAGVYLVAQTLEQWPDWASCAATLQNGV